MRFSGKGAVKFMSTIEIIKRVVYNLSNCAAACAIVSSVWTSGGSTRFDGKDLSMRNYPSTVEWTTGMPPSILRFPGNT
jgi:hypothetical protein